MAEIVKKSQSYEEIFEQKRSELDQLVKKYNGIMIGHPNSKDVSSLADFKARIVIGEKLSDEDQKEADKIAHKFMGSFC